MPRFYVGNVPFDATEADFRDFFADYKVKEVKVILDRETRRSRGFGFVEVEDGDATVEEIVADLNGRDFCGREARVNEAEPQPKGRGPARGRPRPRTPRNGSAGRDDIWK